MSTHRRYALIYDRKVRWHLAKINRRYHSLIRHGIEDSLITEPEIETRNRKPLLQPSVLGTAWELRLGPNNRFRVFYRTDHEARQVYVLAIGVKRGNRLYVGEQEFEL